MLEIFVIIKHNFVLKCANAGTKCSMDIHLVKVTSGYQDRFSDRLLWQGSVDYLFKFQVLDLKI